MKKIALVIIFLTTSLLMQAHQPDISTTMLVQQENDTWVLQITGSLTAFQQEVRSHFAETPYKTPEEFKEMVITHIKNNISIKVNNRESLLILEHGFVKLGHETKVVFQVMGIPDSLTSINVTNTAFRDINRSQSALVLLKKGFSKEHFVLNKSNDFALNLNVEDHKFVKQTDNQANFLSTKILLALVVLGLVVFIYQKIKEKRQVPISIKTAVLTIVKD